MKETEREKGLEIISCPDACAAFHAAASAARRTTEDLGQRTVVLVPDKYTLYTEKLIFGGGGAFMLDVVTLNRLFGLLIADEKKEYLPRQGAVMLIKRIVSGLSDSELGCFKRSAAFPGFAEKIYETIIQLRAGGVKPYNLEADGGLKLKLDALGNIYREYEAQTANRYVDASGRLDMLTEAIPNSEYVRNTRFFAVGFTDITHQAKRIFELLGKYGAEGLRFYSAAPNTVLKAQSVQSLKVYRAKDTVTELKSAASHIREYAFLRGKKLEDGRIDGRVFGDVRVVTQASYEQIKRIFDEYEIPFYLDKKLNLGEHPLMRFTADAVACSAKDKRRADMIALSKSAFCIDDRRDADAFENFCNRMRIDRGGFDESFSGRYGGKRTQSIADEESRAERVRVKLIKVLEFIKNRPYSSAELADALNKLWEFVEAERRCGEISEKAKEGLGADYGAAYEKLKALLGLTAKLGDDSRKKLESAFAVLYDGAKSVDIASIPVKGGVVQIGPPETFRGQRSPLTVIIDFNEGELPQYKTDCGMITDADIEILDASGSGGEIRPRISDVNAAAESELIGVINSSERTIAYFRDDGESKPSSILRRLLLRLGEENAASVEDELAAARKAAVPNDECGKAAVTACSSVAAAREFVILSESDERAGIAPSRAATAVGDALKSVAKQNGTIATLPTPEKLGVTVSNGRELFFSSPTSVSQLQTYFKCPFRHYFQYGLKLKPREDGLVSVLDVGNILHRTVELFVAADCPENVAAFVLDAIDDQVNGEVKYGYADNRAVITRLYGEATKLCSVIARQLSSGDYKKFGTEMKFPSEGGKPFGKFVLDTESGGIELRGILDRVDVCSPEDGDGESKPFARVVDYKTGKAEFRFEDVYYGGKLQLAAYMKVLLDAGFRAGGAFFFPCSAEWEEKERSHTLSGPFNRADAVLVAADRELGVAHDENYKSTVLKVTLRKNKVGSDGLINCKAAVTEEDLNDMADYAQRVMEIAATEAAEGFVAPTPQRDGRDCACDWCDYALTCRLGRVEREIGTVGTAAFRSDGKSGAPKNDGEGEDYE